MESELILTDQDGYKYKRRQNEWTLNHALIEWYVYGGTANGWVRIRDSATILNLEQDFHNDD